MLRLRCFGGLELTSESGPIAPAVAQPLRLAILAAMANASDRETRRDKLLVLFWPDSDQRRGGAALAQALYVLRRELGGDVFAGQGTRVRINPDRLQSDVGDFARYVDRRQLEAAVNTYGGPFLDGFHLPQCPEFERWVDAERARHAERYANALEALASDATKRADHSAAAKWWRLLAAVDSLNSRTAAALTRALAQSGDRAGALQHALEHQTRLKEELGLGQDGGLVELVAQIRRTAAAESQPSGDDAGRNPVSVDLTTTRAKTSVSSATLPVAPRHFSRRPSTLLAAALALVAIVAFSFQLGSPSPTSARATRGEVVAVMPFVVNGDSANGYLREGMPTLISAKLAGGDGIRAVDPGLVLQRWRHAPEITSLDDATLTTLATVARDVGASLIVDGSIVASPRRLVIRARVREASTRRLRSEMSVEGPPDSLTTLVDRLVSQLLATQAGETGPRLAYLTSTSLPALKAYLSGQAAYRQGAYGRAVALFRQAVAEDSTFALANLGLTLALGWALQPDDGRAILRALRWKARLSEADRAFLLAFGIGQPEPRPTQSAYRAGWEHAVTVAPERPEVWYHLGDMYFHLPNAIGPDSLRQRASSAFSRALQLDSLFAPAVFHLFQLYASIGDTSGARRLGDRYLTIDPGSELSPYVRWRMAQWAVDPLAAQQIRAAIDTMPWPSMRAIIMTSQFDGVGADDGDRALRARTRLAATVAERYELLELQHGMALNRGRPADALATTARIEEVSPGKDEALRLRILDAIYSDGDVLAARDAATVLEEHTRTATYRAADETRWSRNTCVLQQWQLHQGLTVRAAHAIGALHRASFAPQSTPLSEAIGCATLLDAWLATLTDDASRARKLAALDSLVDDGPGMEDLLSYLALARARLHLAQGDVPGALRAARRRFYMAYYPPYLSSHILSEARAAMRTGDSSGATASYRQYLVLRARADSSLSAVVDTVRREYVRAQTGASSRETLSRSPQ